MVRRIIAAHGRRVAAADPEDLAALAALHETIASALTVAVEGQRAAGFSWEQIGRGLGTTRQAAWQRFGGIVDLGSRITSEDHRSYLGA